MFDNVHFEGTINLGAIVVALIQLVSAITVFIRVRTLIEQNGLKLQFPRKKKPPPPPPPPPPDDSQKVP